MIQDQIYISCALYSFFQYILFLIYIKFIEKKITVKDFNQISEKIDTIVQESVKEYFNKYNVDKTDALIVLTDIFIQRFNDAIMNPNSGLINYGENVEETIKTNKKDIRKFILNTIDKIVMEHSRDDILSQMFNVVFGQNNIFGEKELANINKLLTIIYKEETNYNEIHSNRLQIEDSSGGKKRNKNRTKTNKRKINRKTRRLIKTSRMRKTKKNKKRKTKKK
jgi:predicted Zn-dependent protease